MPRKDVDAFEDEMRAGGVDWQLVIYGGAVHGFTNRASGSDKSPGARRTTPRPIAVRRMPQKQAGECRESLVIAEQ